MKVRLLGCLLACSKRTAIYSGAGLSTASGVRQVFLAEFPLNHFKTVSETKERHDLLCQNFDFNIHQAAVGERKRVEGFEKKTKKSLV